MQLVIMEVKRPGSSTPTLSRLIISYRKVATFLQFIQKIGQKILRIISRKVKK